MICTICGEPATCSVNTMSGACGSYVTQPEDFAPRCAKHGLFGREMMLVKKNQWQPISTAPKDGTEVLTYRGAKLMAVAIWMKQGWLVVDRCYIINVTHWMPLPEPPA